MKLDITIQEEKAIDLSFQQDEKLLDFCFTDGANFAPYQGDYEITPRISEQVLYTKNKYMKHDVTIYQTPFSMVSNPEGGETVTIGLE